MKKNAPRMYMQLADSIIEKIQTEEIKVGDCIPPERKLAEQLNVSRSVVREAMVYLELIGVTEIKKGAGVFVISKAPTLSNTPSTKVTPYEILEARLNLEPELAFRAAQNNTDELIEKLSNCIKMMETSMLFSEDDLKKRTSIDADRQFHKTIANACTNPLFRNFHQELMSLHMIGEIWERMDELVDEPASRGRWECDHKEVFEAIKKGEPEKARTAMIKHISNIINELTQ